MPDDFWTLTTMSRADLTLLLDERDALRAAARWIPVAERLPEEGEPVLAVISTGPGGWQMDVMVYRPAILMPWRLFCMPHIGPGEGRPVTHWRPLPTGPEAAAMTYPRQEFPTGAVGPDEQLRTGDMLVLVAADRVAGPFIEAVRFENRNGGRCRRPGGLGFWHELGRMPGPWAVFRVDPAHSGGHSTRNDPNALAYLNNLRRIEAAELRARADKLLALVEEVQP